MLTKIIRTFSTQRSRRLFLFPGQGTQEVGMLDSLPDSQKAAVVARASHLLGVDLSQIASTDKDKRISQTQITQPLLVLSHYLYFRHQGHHLTLSAKDWMIGHSLGEFSALVNAGSLSLDDGLQLVHLRGRLMKKYTTTPHGMLIVKYRTDKEEAILGQIKNAGLEIACINTKTNIIVAGPNSALQPLSKALRSHQAAALSLPVSNAFHCKMLEPMRQEFQEALQRVRFMPPLCKILRNYDCKVYENEQDIREGLLLQLTNPVRFAESVEKVPLEDQIVEVGHKAWISKFAQEVRKTTFLQSLI